MCEEKKCLHQCCEEFKAVSGKQTEKIKHSVDGCMLINELLALADRRLLLTKAMGTRMSYSGAFVHASVKSDLQSF